MSQKCLHNTRNKCKYYSHIHQYNTVLAKPSYCLQTTSKHIKHAHSPYVCSNFFQCMMWTNALHMLSPRRTWVVVFAKFLQNISKNPADKLVYEYPHLWWKQNRIPKLESSDLFAVDYNMAPKIAFFRLHNMRKKVLECNSEKCNESPEEKNCSRC